MLRTSPDGGATDHYTTPVAITAGETTLNVTAGLRNRPRATPLFGIVALTDHRLIVGHRADGQLYRIDLDGTGGHTARPVPCAGCGWIAS